MSFARHFVFLFGLGFVTSAGLSPAHAAQDDDFLFEEDPDEDEDDVEIERIEDEDEFELDGDDSELDEVENAWCEVGKALVGRARTAGSRLRPLRHREPVREAGGDQAMRRARYAYGGAYGVLAMRRDARGAPLGLSPWPHVAAYGS